MRYSDEPLAVTVVGLGSRGLSVLERLVALAGTAAGDGRRVRIDVVDPACTGAGLHATDQPDYLLLNTPCGQLSMFPDACTLGDAAGPPGPSLFEWAVGRAMRLADDGSSLDPAGHDVRPWDFLPRHVLGRYLEWFRGRVEARARGRVELRRHRTAALDLGRESDGTLRLALADGTSLCAEHAFLTLGHTPNVWEDAARPGAERILPAPYPLPAVVSRVEPGQSVAVQGFGLSAIDVITALTRGRGGRFVAEGRALHYQPSGREPTLVLFSHSGVPFRARPRVCRFDRVHRPLVFRPAAIDDLRATRGRRLDFERDLLPLILTEMRIAYRECQAARSPARGAERDLRRRLETECMDAVLDELDGRLDRFDALAAWRGGSGMALAGAGAYQGWLAGIVRRDLAEADLGTSRSPFKAALDVLRQLRDTIRYAVDFGGLTDDSQEAFAHCAVPAMNRAVVGPQYERHEELLALLRAGVLRAPLGPAPEVAWNPRSGRWRLTSTALDRPCSLEVDWLCTARVPSPTVDASANPLVDALFRKGWIRPYRAASPWLRGADVDPDQHPVDAGGRSRRRLWMLGPLCEGVTFYNHLVPSPRTWSRPIADAHRCVTAIYQSSDEPGALALPSREARRTP